MEFMSIRSWAGYLVLAHTLGISHQFMAKDSIAGTLLAGTVGFDVNTSWVQLALWATYLGLVLRLYTRPARTAQNSIN